MSENAAQQLIAQRIEYYRTLKGMQQAKLSELMGFKNRQTLSDIERRARNVSSDELKKFADIFGVSPMAIVDAFQPALSVEFSWRTSDAKTAFSDFEQQGTELLNLITTLRRKLDIDPITIPALRLGKQSSFEDVEHAANKLINTYQLGGFPAARLEALYEKLNIDCVYLQLPEHTSGATMVSDEAVLAVVNANEVKGRRNFDKAHELFHCMTWRTMPPQHIDITLKQGKKSRTETLADVFASALLMPKDTVLNELPEKLTIESLMALADRFEVSTDALVWRLVALKKMKKADGRKIIDSGIPAGNGNSDNTQPHSLLSFPVLDVIAQGIDTGLISVRRVAAILNMTIDKLAETYQSHDLNPPFDL